MSQRLNQVSAELAVDLATTADNLRRALLRVDVELSYDRDGVAALDAYLERNARHWSEDEVDQVALVAGCFLGECLIRTIPGARWGREGSEGPFAVLLPGEIGAALPGNKVRKQASAGPGDSVLSFFDVMHAVVGAGGIEGLSA